MHIIPSQCRRQPLHDVYENKGFKHVHSSILCILVRWNTIEGYLVQHYEH